MEVDMMTKVQELMNFQEPVKDQGEKEQGEDAGGKGDEAEEAGEGTAMEYLFSIVKGMKGKGKGGKGGKGGKFDGTCSHCGVYGHRLRECWKKDKEMEEYRKGKGKGKGGKDGKGQWGGWNHWGGNDGGKNNWYTKGKGKGQYSLDAWGWNDASQASKAAAWCMNLTAATPLNCLPCGAPPGLGGGFEILRSQDLEEENHEYAESDFPVVGGDADKSKKKMPRMPNYSKGQVRKLQVNMLQKTTRANKEKGVKKNDVKEMNRVCCLFEKVKPAKDLCPFVSSGKDAQGWRKITGVMDSGASQSVAPPEMCPEYEVIPSVGSRAGQHYVSASDDIIKNLGEQHLDVVMSTGKETVARYQIADVVRPLNAISEICDAGGEDGQHVVFGKHGGAVINLKTGEHTPFSREEDIYTMDMWVKPKGYDAAQGFTRQG